MTYSKVARITELKNEARKIRNQQYYAAQAKNANSFGELETELQKVYAEIDKLQK